MEAEDSWDLRSDLHKSLGRVRSTPPLCIHKCNNNLQLHPYYCFELFVHLIVRLTLLFMLSRLLIGSILLAINDYLEA